MGAVDAYESQNRDTANKMNEVVGKLIEVQQQKAEVEAELQATVLEKEELEATLEEAFASLADAPATLEQVASRSWPADGPLMAR